MDFKFLDNGKYMKKTNLSRFSAAVFLVCAVAACGKGETAKKEGPVAAKVDGEEITVNQLDQALLRAGMMNEQQARLAKKQALNALIDQQLLVKKALEQKLDRDPTVLQAIETAKRQLLAQAYLEKMLQQAGKPTSEEIKAYYSAHPDLFEHRHIYRLQEMRVVAEPDKFDAIKAELGHAKNLESFVVWLKSQNIPFTGSGIVKPAEDLPLDLVPKLNQLKDGGILTFEGKDGLQIIQLLASQEQSVSEQQAVQAIERFLSNKKRTEIAQAEIKKLHDASKIEFVGEFGDAAASDKPAAAAQPVPASGVNSIDKGLGSLK